MGLPRRDLFAGLWPCQDGLLGIEKNRHGRGFDVPVVTGKFQAAMEVSLVNAGPVTILLDTEKLF